MNTNSVTIVTALYDINRESFGDGRSINNYFNWLYNTFQLNSQFILFIEDKLYIDFSKNFNIDSFKNRINIKVTSLNDIPYYKYKTEMDSILINQEYLNSIKDPSRIECKLSMYNIIQYSKLEWIREAIKENPFNSNYFFWMDAGCSRFFDNTNISLQWPNLNNSYFNNKIIIQGRNDLHYYYNWHLLHLDSANLLCGTMFGGNKENLLWLADMTHTIFKNLLDNKIVNNEQIALALIWKDFPDNFNVFINNTNSHLPLFKALSIN